MSSYDDLRRQVESLRQVNSGLHREIQDNNAQLSRLQENSAHLAQSAASSVSQGQRSQNVRLNSAADQTRSTVSSAHQSCSASQVQRSQAAGLDSSAHFTQLVVSYASQGQRSQNASLDSFSTQRSQGGGSQQVPRSQANFLLQTSQSQSHSSNKISGSQMSTVQMMQVAKVQGSVNQQTLGSQQKHPPGHPQTFQNMPDGKANQQKSAAQNMDKVLKAADKSAMEQFNNSHARNIHSQVPLLQNGSISQNAQMQQQQKPVSSGQNPSRQTFSIQNTKQQPVSSHNTVWQSATPQKSQPVSSHNASWQTGTPQKSQSVTSQNASWQTGTPQKSQPVTSQNASWQTGTPQKSQTVTSHNASWQSAIPQKSQQQPGANHGPPWQIVTPQKSQQQPVSSRQSATPQKQQQQPVTLNNAERQTEVNKPAKSQVNHTAWLQDQSSNSSSNPGPNNITSKMGPSTELEEDLSFNEDLMEGEHMATLDDGTDLSDCQTTQLDAVLETDQGEGHPDQGEGHTNQGQGQSSLNTEIDEEKNEQEIRERLQQLDQERTSLVQQIESEEKNRKWYYDQIEIISRKIRSLPVNDGHPGRQPGFTRKHLELEIARLRETMHVGFGTNENIVQRREGRVHRIRQIEEQMIGLQQQRHQMLQENDGQGHRRRRSSSDSAHSSADGDLDNDQVTMATQTDESPGDQQEKLGFGHAIPGSIYHGTWPIGKDDGNIQASISHHGDLSSVMSFNSTNTSSSHGSGSGAKGQGHVASGGQGQTRSLPGQQMPQPIPLNPQIPPQQLGTKVEMVYGLLSMLGTHDKDDMSRTLLAMSSSQDSCIAMRQSGCLPLLIQLLHGSDKDSALLGNTRGSKSARARAAAALHNIVHSHPDDKRGRREARVLRLLEQIRAHCDQLRENSSDEEDEDGKPAHQDLPMDHHPGPAIATLMKLSFDEEHRHAICTLGGLHAIAELLQVDNDIHQDTTEHYNVTMRRYACMALTNLTFGDGTNKSLLCSLKDSMIALVMQLYSSNEELCQVAASVLRNLSWKADLASKKTLREVGGVTTLMEAALRVQKETTLKSILSALWNLSAHCSENKADICAVEGALEFLISTLTYKSPSKTTAIIENGGGILRNVSSHIAVREDYRQILRQHGCLQILLKHLRSPSLTIVSNACGTLWNLSARCAEDQQALWEMGAVGMLRNLVHSKHKMISMGSSAALKNLLAARPQMKNMELNKQASGNRPTLHVRKQRALESEIDQNLSETCENVESPRDSPVESKKQETGHFVYPVYPLLRGPVIPRSQSGDNALYENQLRVNQGVARSGSQDSVGSTHSDISHDRSRHASGGKIATRTQANMGGSLDRHKEGLHLGATQRAHLEGRTERNPLGAPNSRILQVMQEVAQHAGIDDQSHGNDSAVFKTPLPVTNPRSQTHQQPGNTLQQQQSSHQQQQQQNLYQQNPPFPTHLINGPQSSAYFRYLVANGAHNQSNQFSLPNTVYQNQRLQHQEQNNDEGDDEQPLDYSMKYQEGGSNQRNQRMGPQPPPPMRGNFMGNQQHPPNSVQNQYGSANKNMYFKQQQGNKQFAYNSAYAETDLDDPDQPTDYSARYGAEYNADQYGNQRINYAAQYGDSYPNCADCKLAEARRYNDRYDQAIEDDQIKTFCTEDTPYLSTATSLTDLSTAVKILEEAEQHCPGEENDDETHNFSSKYGETDNVDKVQSSRSDSSQRSDPGQRYEGDKSSRSGSNATDIQTGTTVIANYNLKPDRRSQESNSHETEEQQERSFHDNRNDDAPYDQTKTYCEEGTPVCFSRVSSLSSLHSSEAADRQDPGKRLNPLESIDERGDLTSNSRKLQAQPMTPNNYRQKPDESKEANSDSTEKEHKTVTFDDKEQVQETPMMFSRCTSLGSLSSFDTQSVHSSVFSEYSRRASEVVSPSELPDSPSETMPPSPRRTKSPERNPNRKPVNQELFPPSNSGSLPSHFSTKMNQSAQGVTPLGRYMALNAAADRVIDYETGSSKSEAPVVYADEGTPPIFSDNLSELSCITSDNYNINEKTLVDTPQSKGSHGNSSQGFKSDLNKTSQSASSKSSSVSVVNETVIENKGQGENGGADKKMSENKNSDQKTVNDKKEIKETTEKKVEDKGVSSNSDVSEGEDDLLANIISSAMPISSKKIRKSSSDNAIKRRSNSSSKGDSGSSSRSSKTPAKSGQQGDSKPSSGESSAKKSLKMSPDQKSKSSGQSSTTGQGQGSPGSSPGKQKSQIPRPLQHRQVQQLALLNISMDSTGSGSAEDSPFNTSNTQSVILKSTKNPNPVQNPAMILQKARNLSNMDDGEEGIKTYATEDTPFSGSMQTSPRPARKFSDSQLLEANQDTVKSFATEDTPFSGSVPHSPKLSKRNEFQDDFDTEADSIKCYQTEDTPFSGSAFASPKIGSPTATRKSVPQQPGAKKPIQTGAHVQNSGFVKPLAQTRNQPVSSKQELPQKPDAKAPQMTQGGTKTQGQGQPSSRLPKKLPNQFNPQLFSYLQNDFDGGDDMIKTYATEGTPQNYSRTGSCSDLSSLNTNFDEKVEDKGANVNPAGAEESDSSSLGENEELLSELIQSAMPSPKAAKSRRSMDRRPEGAERKPSETSSNTSDKNARSKSLDQSVPLHFQPKRTSSLAQDGKSRQSSQPCQSFRGDPWQDEVKSYAVEDTPRNLSQATSLTDLTAATSGLANDKSSQPKGRKSLPSSVNNNSTLGTSYNHSATFGNAYDSVFLHSDGGGDSMKVYCTEGTPKTFSCNDSLSSLSIMTDDSKYEIAEQVKVLAGQLTKNNASQAQPLRSNAAEGSEDKQQEQKAASLQNVAKRPDSRNSNLSNSSRISEREIERHVVGQSSEEHSVKEEQITKVQTDEIRKYGVEDTPLCFSRNSSLSDIHDLDVENKEDNSKKQKPQEQKIQAHSKHASRDEQAGFKVEHTPICFSRNSSLSSISIHSDEDDDPEDLALLEDCISSAMPPKTRPSREELRRNRSDYNNKSRGNNQRTSGHPGYKRNASSGDELERSGEHDSRYSNWRQQPHKSNDEIFRKPTMDAKGRPCRRSRSQDSEKHFKDLSNQHLAQYGANVHGGSWDSLALTNNRAEFLNMDTEEYQRQQLISETQNIVHQVQKMTRSVEKGDDHESEKTDSPASDYNFFMTCSGNTEISVESISKISFPSSMAPDTDDDILEASLGSYRFQADGDEDEPEQGNHELTLTGGNMPKSLNSTLTENQHINRRNGGRITGMEGSITSEDERALAENANIVMSEMMSRMVLSGASSVDDENFIENETLSLVSNGYMSDTASEASNTWSAGSDFPSEGSNSRLNGSGHKSRPRIVKPGEGKENKPTVNENDVKAVRGKRKPLYSSKSVSSASSSSIASTTKSPKGKTQNVASTGKMSPRTVPGAPSPQNGNLSVTNKKSLRTMPQASSTPVKASQATQRVKPETPQRSLSLDQRSSPTSRQTLGNRSSSTNRSGADNRSGSSNRSDNRSGSSNRSGSASRSGNNSTNKSLGINSPSKIPSRSSPKGSKEMNGTPEKPKSLSKQGTFVKESTNRNAPVISPDEKNKENIVGIRMRQNKTSTSSDVNRNSSGSSKSNFSNTSNNSNSFSTTSSDSPPDSWTKALNSYNYMAEQSVNENSGKKKDSRLRRSFGTSELKNSPRSSLNSSNSKIPSPCRPGLNKSGSGQSLKKSSSKDQVSKSSSGVSLASVTSGGLIKTGSNSSLRQTDSRPMTPVNMSRHGSQGSEINSKKQNSKKGVTSKIVGLWKSEDKSKNKAEKKLNSSKLPVAKGKTKMKENKKKEKDDGQSKEKSEKGNIKRNTYILEESTVDGLSRSSTYDKLKATNDESQIPVHDGTRVSSVGMNKSSSGSSNEMNMKKQIKSIFDDNELNKTCRDFSAFEIGVEYNLDDAWASNVEKSIEVMSRSIEENKNRIESFYDDTVDTSKMDLTGSPAKRLSKSGSMSEIELEFGRIHSGTWTKKKSHNDSSVLPDAEETSRTLPLVKRSESLNFSSNMTVSHYDYDEKQEVWIRRDDKLRASDISGLSKKKKGFKGSSGFLNAVSKMFGGGAKKSSDKQSKTMLVLEKDSKKMNESSVKSKKEKESKMNKSEVKLSKAEQKLLKAELKAQAKLNKSELKQSKKEAKLNKSLKGKGVADIDDNSSQTLGSSTSSLKKSAEYLLEIDKSDDEDICVNGHISTIPLTGSETGRFEQSKTSPKSPEQIRAQLKQSSLNSLHSSSDTPHSNNLNQSGASSESDRSDSLGEKTQPQSIVNKSVRNSPTQHQTKTEMLLARRQAQLNTSQDNSESEGEQSGRKRSIITTV